MWEQFYVSNETGSNRFNQVFNGKYAEVIINGDDMRKLTITIAKYVGVDNEGEPCWRSVLDIRDIVNLWRDDLFSQIERLISLFCYGVNASSSYRMCLQIHPKLTEEMTKELEYNYDNKD